MLEITCTQVMYLQYILETSGWVWRELSCSVFELAQHRILGSVSLEPGGMSGEVYLGLVSSILILTTEMQRTSFWEYARHLGTSPCLQRANGSQTVHEKAHVTLIFQMGSSPSSSSVWSIFLAQYSWQEGEWTNWEKGNQDSPLCVVSPQLALFAAQYCNLCFPWGHLKIFVQFLIYSPVRSV